MPMNNTATTFLNQNSKDFIFLYRFPTPDIVYAITHANRITGMPVAMAKTTGKCNPDVDTVNGISIPK